VEVKAPQQRFKDHDWIGVKDYQLYKYANYTNTLIFEVWLDGFTIYRVDDILKGELREISAYAHDKAKGWGYYTFLNWHRDNWI